ncbi:seryl-tRNA synthetase [Polaribacter irgensii 23-P]|uniref:Seryl-tRNA synthetase n=1 Tax=Polaribacter irgensii 23-P TaxID=313594 RepID=A4BXE8_9FLAO|nr:seryl-tRNA synthetase [Polaribacter irgensii 23-P]
MIGSSKIKRGQLNAVFFLFKSFQTFWGIRFVLKIVAIAII